LDQSVFSEASLLITLFNKISLFLSFIFLVTKIPPNLKQLI